MVIGWEKFGIGRCIFSASLATASVQRRTEGFL